MYKKPHSRLQGFFKGKKEEGELKGVCSSRKDATGKSSSLSP